MEKARIALIGAGWWGVEVYLPELESNPEIDLVGINRRDRASLDQILAKYPNSRGYTDYREMLEKEEPDAVVVTSPHTAHFEHGRQSLEAGCHVLIDKPMTTSAEDARSLVKLAAEMGKEILVPYGWNYKEFATTASKLIAEGRVGEIRHATCAMATFTYDLFSGHGLKETENHMFRPKRSTWGRTPAMRADTAGGSLAHALGLLFRPCGYCAGQGLRARREVGSAGRFDECGGADPRERSDGQHIGKRARAEALQLPDGRSRLR